MKLRLGFSPCPNDTFMFHRLVHGGAAAHGLHVGTVMEDIEALNRRALDPSPQQWLEITKVSVAVVGSLLHRYTVLETGAALGRGCGPLVVVRDDAKLGSLLDLVDRKVAIPGTNTTANLLMKVFAPEGWVPVEMPFDQIMPAVARGECEAGLIIHESRFTYPDFELRALLDLGEAWEQDTGLPLPLGVIMARRTLPKELRDRVAAAIGESIDKGFADREASWDWVREHSQEIAPDVCRQHIDLYVNDYSRGLGDEGRQALDTLLHCASQV